MKPTTYFGQVPVIPFEGPESDNPLAFRYYDAHRLVLGKPMKDHFRFSVAWWHSLGNTGQSAFGGPTKHYPWNAPGERLARARAKMDAGFEFMQKLGIDYYTFHDIDLIEEVPDLTGYRNNLDAITDYALEKQAETGIKPIWGTANLTYNPVFMNGAATNPEFDSLAMAGAHVKTALDMVMKLGGEGYAFWGGREGYDSLLNTHMQRDLDHLARYYEMIRDYARSNGFKGYFYIEPKPGEPSKHMYDFDASTVVGFLTHYGLRDDFKLNVEVNHANMALHTIQHELQVAANHGMLGSMDANRGDYQNGWDTDLFANNLYEIVETLLVVIEAGGFQGGGINFDAKTRRNSTDLVDLFYGHIGSMDAYARALLAVESIVNEGKMAEFKANRYASFDAGIGRDFEQGRLKLEDLYDHALKTGNPAPKSGRQEWLENLINRHI